MANTPYSEQMLSILRQLTSGDGTTQSNADKAVQMMNDMGLTLRDLPESIQSYLNVDRTGKLLLSPDKNASVGLNVSATSALMQVGENPANPFTGQAATKVAPQTSPTNTAATQNSAAVNGIKILAPDFDAIKSGSSDLKTELGKIYQEHMTNPDNTSLPLDYALMYNPAYLEIDPNTGKRKYMPEADLRPRGTQTVAPSTVVPPVSTPAQTVTPAPQQKKADTVDALLSKPVTAPALTSEPVQQSVTPPTYAPGDSSNPNPQPASQPVSEADEPVVSMPQGQFIAMMSVFAQEQIQKALQQQQASTPGISLGQFKQTLGG